MSLEFDEIMSTFALRLDDHPDFMAVVLSQYLAIEGLTRGALEEELAISPGSYNRLSMCRRPKKDSPDFAKDVEAISDYTLADAIALTRIIRHVDSISGMQAPLQVDPSERTVVRAPVPDILFAAARDKIEDDEEDTLESESD